MFFRRGARRPGQNGELALKLSGPSWHKQLLDIAVADVPGVRRAILSEEAFAGLKSMLRMRCATSSDQTMPAISSLHASRDLHAFAHGLVHGLGDAPPAPAPKQSDPESTIALLLLQPRIVGPDAPRRRVNRVAPSRRAQRAAHLGVTPRQNGKTTRKSRANPAFF
jgi:hypothetical protein